MVETNLNPTTTQFQQYPVTEQGLNASYGTYSDAGIVKGVDPRLSTTALPVQQPMMASTATGMGVPPTTGVAPTTTTTAAPAHGVMGKWKSRRQAKKLKKNKNKKGIATTGATTAATTGTGLTGTSIEVEKTLHETFYSMPVVVGQTGATPAFDNTKGPKLTRKEKRAWKKREKREAAAINTGSAGVGGRMENAKLMHDLKHDKLGPIHPATTIIQQQPLNPAPTMMTANPTMMNTAPMMGTTTTSTYTSVPVSQMQNMNLGL